MVLGQGMQPAQTVLEVERLTGVGVFVHMRRPSSWR